MSRDLEDLIPAARALAQQLIAACEQRGTPVFVTSTLRTFHEQDLLYAQGRTAPGPIVTNAQAGESRHNYGLAFDVAFRAPPAGSPFGDENPWEEIGSLGKALGLEWGGDWTRLRDRPHFQLPSPYDVATLRAATISRLRRDMPAAAAPVRELQGLLNRAGFPAGAVDGEFGPLTEAAVQALQRAAGLVPSGIVQLRELEALEARLS